MYGFFSDISSLLSEPFLNIAYGMEHIPLIAALFLGLVGAVSPCQFTGNIGAITIYGNRSLQKQTPWLHVCLFILGKVFVFSTLGMIVWLFGKEFQTSLTYYFPVIRKVIGPFLILMGLYMIGLFKLRWTFSLWKVPEKYLKDSKLGSFLMGVSFTLAFCPTMFILFFMTLMPIVVTTSYGAVLPTVFAIGTSMPLFIVVFLIWYFELSGSFMKKGRKIGMIIQKMAGGLMIILGILDAMTYW